MSKVKIFLASIVWLCILGVCVLLYRWWWKPATEAEAKKKQDEVVLATSGSSNFKHTVKLGLDGFSGYAVIRSSEFGRQLRSAGIKLETVDDSGDYGARLSALADGRLQMAAFPIDALISASEAKKSLPATVIAILDESTGADALLAYKDRFPNIDSLNSADTRFVLVKDSPSETLFRILLHDFRLDKLNPAAVVSVSSTEELVKRYRDAKPNGNEVFVTWEPIVSELRANDAMHVLTDTNAKRGYIVDALVVSRDFLLKNPDVVRQVLESYFRTLYNYRTTEKMMELVRSDAKGVTLSQVQVQNLVQGIQWKNTQENFAHFGIRNSGLPNIEDMIDRVKRVLIDTKAIASDPTNGDTSKLFYDATLRELSTSGFHPGVDVEDVRKVAELAVLSDEEWSKLVPVGTLAQPPLVFARGRDTLTETSRLSLDELAEKLETWPLYYLKVVGSAGSLGSDVEANRKLAKMRAQSAAAYLQSKGVPASRIRAIGDDAVATGKGGDMSVSFVFVQTPY